MNVTLRRLKWGMIVAGLVLAAFPLAPAISPYFLLVMVLLTGIPHGAIDHVIYKNSHTGSALKVTVAFYAEYALWIGALSLLWWLAPQVAMVLFLAVSAYHFGQTQLAYLKPFEGVRALYLIWGLLVVGGLVVSHAYVLSYGFTQIIPVANLQHLASRARPYIELVTCVVIVALVYCLHTRPRALFLELLELTVLTLVFLRNDFYTSFGLFFGGWHSLNAIHNSLQDVGRFERFTLWRFVRASLPHSIASLGGIVAIVYLTTHLQHSVSTELLLFMTLSVLALPHIVVLEQWYAFLGKLPQKAATSLE